MPTRRLSVSRQPPEVVRGPARPLLAEPLRRVAPLRLRRLVGLPAGPGGPPRPAGPGRDGDHGRLGDVAGTPDRRHPPLPAEPGPGEGAAARRSGPQPGPHPRRDPGGGDGLPPRGHGAMAREEARPRGPLHGAGATLRPVRYDPEARTHGEPVRPAKGGRGRLGHGPDRDGGRPRPLPRRKPAEPHHAGVQRRAPRHREAAAARSHGVEHHRGGRHPRAATCRPCEAPPADRRVPGVRRGRVWEQRAGPRDADLLDVRGARGVPPRIGSRADRGPRVLPRTEDVPGGDRGRVPRHPSPGPRVLRPGAPPGRGDRVHGGVQGLDPPRGLAVPGDRPGRARGASRHVRGALRGAGVPPGTPPPPARAVAPSEPPPAIPRPPAPAVGLPPPRQLRSRTWTTISLMSEFGPWSTMHSTAWTTSSGVSAHSASGTATSSFLPPNSVIT